VLVQVALDIPTEKTFTYLVPVPLRDVVGIGSRVAVPFGGRSLVGYVVSLEGEADVSSVKEIEGTIGEGPVFCAADLPFYTWVADYYLHPLGKVLAEILPFRGREGSRRIKAEGEGKTPGDGGRVSEAVGVRHLLNADQRRVLDEIRRAVDGGSFQSCLLHGVTGSGKTEIYLRLIAHVMKENGGVLYLVPEIGLTGQLISRLRERFPSEPLAILHSGLTTAKRREAWLSLLRGGVRLAVGARSAVFAPVGNLRLIIVDEEHDESYKQDERMRYNARDLALVRGRMTGATVVLGSATPSVQTYYHALLGRHRLLVMPRRVEERPLPKVDIVDLRLERGEKDEESLILSRYLRTAMRETLNRGKQVLLLLNRRGFHTLRLCRECGGVVRCRNCSVSLIYHAAEGVLRCHYCDYSVRAEAVCPACGGGPIVSYGFGTERLAEAVSRFFPGSRVARMDRDTTKGRGSHEMILGALGRGEIDILVGTQMVSKGHDYPGVVLVGIVSADTALHLPDFRAAERTFQLLTQASGRGGRGEDPGRVIIQTFNPGHYALQWAKNHDYAGFFRQEIDLRRQLGYPPFSRLVQFLVSGPGEEKTVEAALLLAAEGKRLMGTLGLRENVEIVGPAEAPIARLRGRYRRHLLLKGRDSRDIHLLAAEMGRLRLPRAVELRVDIDPMNFL